MPCLARVVCVCIFCSSPSIRSVSPVSTGSSVYTGDYHIIIIYFEYVHCLQMFVEKKTELSHLATDLKTFFFYMQLFKIFQTTQWQSS